MSELDTTGKLLAVSLDIYQTSRERAAMRCALSDATALLDSIANEIREANRAKGTSKHITKQGHQWAAIAERCANAIWAMRERISTRQS